MQQYDRYPFLSSYCQFLVASAVYLYCHVLCQAGLPADRSNASAILPGLPSGYFSCSFRITVTGSHRTLTCFPFHRTKRPTPHTIYNIAHFFALYTMQKSRCPYVDIRFQLYIRRRQEKEDTYGKDSRCRCSSDGPRPGL